MNFKQGSHSDLDFFECTLQELSNWKLSNKSTESSSISIEEKQKFCLLMYVFF